MMTVDEVSKISGVSIRTLQYYDSISLLKPADYTEAGYRLYDEKSLERLQIILLFRELQGSGRRNAGGRFPPFSRQRPPRGIDFRALCSYNKIKRIAFIYNSKETKERIHIWHLLML